MWMWLATFEYQTSNYTASQGICHTVGRYQLVATSTERQCESPFHQVSISKRFSTLYSTQSC